MAELEPKWVVSVRGWWENLLGPLLTTMVDEVRRKAGNSALAEKASGGTVRRFEAELAALEADVTAFQAQALGSEWLPYADRAAEILSNIKGQWLDPAATQPLEGGVAGVASVLRGINVAVTAIAIAWAAVSIGEVRLGAEAAAELVGRPVRGRASHQADREARGAGRGGRGTAAVPSSSAPSSSSPDASPRTGAAAGRGARRARLRRGPAAGWPPVAALAAGRLTVSLASAWLEDFRT